MARGKGRLATGAAEPVNVKKTNGDKTRSKLEKADREGWREGGLFNGQLVGKLETFESNGLKGNIEKECYIENTKCLW